MQCQCWSLTAMNRMSDGFYMHFGNPKHKWDVHLIFELGYNRQPEQSTHTHKHIFPELGNKIRAHLTFKINTGNGLLFLQANLWAFNDPQILCSAMWIWLMVPPKLHACARLLILTTLMLTSYYLHEWDKNYCEQFIILNIHDLIYSI